MSGSDFLLLDLAKDVALEVALIAEKTPFGFTHCADSKFCRDEFKGAEQVGGLEKSVVFRSDIWHKFNLGTFTTDERPYMHAMVSAKSVHVQPILKMINPRRYVCILIVKDEADKIKARRILIGLETSRLIYKYTDFLYLHDSLPSHETAHLSRNG